MRLGTRGSALALAQASWVAARLEALGEAVELVTVTTRGDRDRSGGDKARWVGALEDALLEGRIDFAVHSAKDVPGELPEGLALVAFPPREDPLDVICGAASLDALTPGARVGTSSLRRAAQIHARHSHVRVVPLRGNVDTRLRKLADGEVDALVLAAAGLHRLGRGEEAGGALDLVPAPGQGALAIEARPEMAPRLRGLSDARTAACVAAERAVVRALGASCETPVGAIARVASHASGDAEHLVLEAWAGLPDGSEWVSDRLEGPASSVGAEVASRLLSAGAGDILERAAAQS